MTTAQIEITEAMVEAGRNAARNKPFNSKTMRDIITAALAVQPAPAPASEPVALPSHGHLSFDELGRDVREAGIGVRDDYGFDPTYFKGHQMVAGINFNSLNRIVSKYAAPAKPPVACEAVAVKAADQAEKLLRVAAHLAATRMQGWCNPLVSDITDVAFDLDPSRREKSTGEVVTSQPALAVPPASTDAAAQEREPRWGEPEHERGRMLDRIAAHEREIERLTKAYDELKANGRKAIEAGEVMIGTLTAERDKLQTEIERLTKELANERDQATEQYHHRLEIVAERDKLQTDITALRREVNDAVYMKAAYYQMLGETGRAVADMWLAKGVKRVHHSWGPEAHKMTGEERAAFIMEVERAPRTKMDFKDGELQRSTATEAKGE